MLRGVNITDPNCGRIAAGRTGVVGRLDEQVNARTIIYMMFKDNSSRQVQTRPFNHAAMSTRNQINLPSIEEQYVRMLSDRTRHLRGSSGESTSPSARRIGNARHGSAPSLGTMFIHLPSSQESGVDDSSTGSYRRTAWLDNSGAHIAPTYIHRNTSSNIDVRQQSCYLCCHPSCTALTSKCVIL